LDLRFEDSLLIAEEDRSCDIFVFVVSYLLWFVVVIAGGQQGEVCCNL
jgi:hypothetical protein